MVGRRRNLIPRTLPCPDLSCDVEAQVAVTYHGTPPEADVGDLAKAFSPRGNATAERETPRKHVDANEEQPGDERRTPAMAARSRRPVARMTSTRCTGERPQPAQGSDEAP